MSYYSAKSIVELPFNLFMAAVFAAFVYYIIVFNPELSRFGTYIVICVLMAFTENSMGIMAGCIFSDVGVSLAKSQMFLFPYILFTGFAINRDNYVLLC